MKYFPASLRLRMTALVAAAGLCAAASAVDAAPVIDDTFACLDSFQGPVRQLRGEAGFAKYRKVQTEDGARFDARGFIIRQQTKPEPVGDAYPVDIRLVSKDATACWAGGTIWNTNSYLISWDASKHPNNAALIFKEGGLIVDGVRIHNAHDGIRPWHRSSDGDGLSSFEVRNSWLSNIRDDCIENDSSAGGLIEDTLFDGCYVFLSARQGDAPPSSTQNVISIRNSLIHLKEMPEPYGHAGEDLYGHGNLFKFGEASPKLELIGNIILIEDLPITKFGPESWRKNAPDMLSLRPERLVTCADNIVIWLGPGKFPGVVPRSKDCVSVTSDRAIWDKARQAWLAAHPLVARIPGVDD